eukprot:2320647-Rhodomonas_salina.6
MQRCHYTVLLSPISLRACYAMSGTILGYNATLVPSTLLVCTAALCLEHFRTDDRLCCYQVDRLADEHGAIVAQYGPKRCPVLSERMVLPVPRRLVCARTGTPGPATNCYALPMRCPALSGTDQAQAATFIAVSAYTVAMRCPVLTSRMVLPAARPRPPRCVLSPYALAVRRAELTYHILLRACYAMSGTDISQAAMLSAYARAMRCAVLRKRMVLHLCGTGLVCSAVYVRDWPSRMILPALACFHLATALLLAFETSGQYCPSVCYYASAVLGTALAYATMPQPYCTDRAYATMPQPYCTDRAYAAIYMCPGTDLAHIGTSLDLRRNISYCEGRPRARQGTVLRHVRYWPTIHATNARYFSARVWYKRLVLQSSSLVQTRGTELGYALYQGYEAAVTDLPPHPATKGLPSGTNKKNASGFPAFLTRFPSVFLTRFWPGFDAACEGRLGAYAFVRAHFARMRVCVHVRQC